MIEASTQRLLDLINRWTDQRETLGRFFNTLSFLEHIGSRKILGSNIVFESEQLQHAAEESRHALKFKQMVRKLGGGDLHDYRTDFLVGGKEPYGYFQRLDATVRSYLKPRFADALERSTINYLLVTYLIELRAAALYPALQDLLDSAGIALNLRGIVREEDRHLAEIVSELGDRVPERDLTELQVAEDRLFLRLIERLESEQTIALMSEANEIATSEE